MAFFVLCAYRVLTSNFNIPNNITTYNLFLNKIRTAKLIVVQQLIYYITLLKSVKLFLLLYGKEYIRAYIGYSCRPFRLLSVCYHIATYHKHLRNKYNRRNHLNYSCFTHDCLPLFIHFHQNRKQKKATHPRNDCRLCLHQFAFGYIGNYSAHYI